MKCKGSTPWPNSSRKILSKGSSTSQTGSAAGNQASNMEERGYLSHTNHRSLFQGLGAIRKKLIVTSLMPRLKFYINSWAFLDERVLRLPRNVRPFSFCGHNEFFIYLIHVLKEIVYLNSALNNTVLMMWEPGVFFLFFLFSAVAVVGSEWISLIFSVLCQLLTWISTRALNVNKMCLAHTCESMCEGRKPKVIVFNILHSTPFKVPLGSDDAGL